MKKTVYIISILLAAICMNSCVQNEADIFDESASARLEKAIAKYRTMLTSNPNGWIIDYYDYDVISSKAPTVGYAMYWKFDGGSVSMACETKTGIPALTEQSSFWDIIEDQGGILTFDLYNPVIHYFCNPSGVSGSVGNEGMGGDFEFVIMGETEDGGLLLTGRRHLVKMVLRPLAAGENGLDYLQKVVEMPSITIGAINFDIKDGGNTVGTAVLQSPRLFSYTYTNEQGEETSATLAFTYTPTGIRLLKSIDVNGKSIFELTWDDDAKNFTDASSGIVLACTDKFPIKPVTPPGDGTDASPYLVSSIAHLMSMSVNLTAVYKLVADIDLNGEIWNPAGPFTGKLYGDNHIIKNIDINTTDQKVGLFSELGADAYIEGVRIAGSIVSNALNAYAGSIAGHINGANVTIKNCGNTASVSAPRGTTAYVGGIVGYINKDNALITGCYNKGEVSGGVYVGGIVGRPANAQNTVTISNCYSDANISSSVTSAYAGGIIGYMYNGGSGYYTIENCYATGTVTNSGNGSAVGIAGRAWNSANTIIQHNVALQSALSGSSSNTVAILGSNVNTGTKENFSSTEMLLNGVLITHPATVAEKNGAAVTPAEAKTAAWYAAKLPSWDFTNVWKITEGNYPVLKWE
ncbi:MAG: DUF4302 domain-containing protein [Dysgonamonadaceae bacterium]|jgi:hypothetical protein|nr:DUF4302 domain-containing protein [Dysgonamonadaceae bacterium]